MNIIKFKLSITSLTLFIVLIIILFNETSAELENWSVYHHNSNQFKQHFNPYGPIPPNYIRFSDYQNNTYYHNSPTYLFWLVHIRKFFGPRLGFRGPFALNNKNLVITKNNKFISLL